MDHDNQLDNILKMRANPPEMRSNLEHRIIRASLTQKAQRKRIGFTFVTGVLSHIQENFILPRPAISMMLVLVFGAMLGVYTAGDNNGDGVVDNDVAAYFLQDSSIDDGAVL